MDVDGLEEDGWRRIGGALEEHWMSGSGLSIERVLSYGSCPWKAEFDSAYRLNVFGPTGHAHGQLCALWESPMYGKVTGTVRWLPQIQQATDMHPHISSASSLRSYFGSKEQAIAPYVHARGRNG